MKKLLWGIVPACISFGPLFMSGMRYEDHLVIAGVLMLSAGLVIMFKTVADQQKLIEKLLAERGIQNSKR